MPWRPGDAIVLREVWASLVFAARPALVVQDEPDQQMFFLPGGVRCGAPVGKDGDELRVPDRPWRLEVRERGPSPILSFAWPEIPYSVLLWSAGTEGRVWYVNMQAPLVRTPIGFDTVDHALDVLVALDRSGWTWKDEDELTDAVAHGLFTKEEAASFRRWGGLAVERIVLREPPFDRDWESWAPDPGWPVPELPEGWDRL
ncbi:MAG: DUF402 domain-containing protein [Actinobacteria bacterium]|nr:DUF402 domain-containing protein [Actinomycetota bacterium]